MTGSDWEIKAEKKRQQLDQLIPSDAKLVEGLVSDDQGDVAHLSPHVLQSVLSGKEFEITESPSVTELLENVKNRFWTAEEVARAFCKRAAIAQQLVSCLSEIFFDRAIAKAKELDAHLQRTGKTIGPLHGLPISLKDQIDVEGVDMTMSYVKGIGHPSKENSVIADILESQGAVLYVKTNMAQAILFGEGLNNVYRRTTNPFNRSLTCGGSSSGEGALGGMRGCLLGVGSDVGGSIRQPAGFQGLYALRPSAHRVPYARTSNSLQGQEAIASVLGPLAVSIDGLKLFMQAVIAAKPWNFDPYVRRQPWNDEFYHLSEHGGENGKLCFAIMWDDGTAKPMPPYIRAMKQVRDALIAKGHNVIDWVPYDHAKGSDLTWAVFMADGGRDIEEACKESGEPRVDYNEEQLQEVRQKALDAYGYWQVCKQREEYVRKQLDHWRATASQTGTGRPVDAIVTPVNANLPPPHGMNLPHSPIRYVGYTSFCNIADYAAATFPVTVVDPKIDAQKSESREYLTKLDQNISEFYDSAKYAGAPVGLQCIAGKGEEEAVIRMTEIIDGALKTGSAK